jgi:hypothetical protein
MTSSGGSGARAAVSGGGGDLDLVALINEVALDHIFEPLRVGPDDHVR